MTVGEICTRTVVTCGPDATATEVARLMRDAHVGDIVVVRERNGRQEPIGILTDRDLVVQVLAQEVDPGALRACDLIRWEIVTAPEDQAVYDAIWDMRRKGIRRLPVDGKNNELKGILTADDVARHLAQQLGDVASIAPQQRKREENLLETTAAR